MSNIIYFGNHRGVRSGCGACANVVEAHIQTSALVTRGVGVNRDPQQSAEL